MESFSGVRQPFFEEKSDPPTALPAGAQEGVAPLETQTETTTKLGALVVVLAPFGIAAWLAIGLSVYRLLT